MPYLVRSRPQTKLGVDRPSRYRQGSAESVPDADIAIPIILGPGVSVRRNCPCMYFLLISVIVFQPRCNSLIIPRFVERRQRLSTMRTNLLVQSRIVGHPREFLLFHLASTPARDALHYDFQKNVQGPSGTVTNEALFVAIDETVGQSAHFANCFSPLRESKDSGLGFPKTLRTTDWRRTSGSRYVLLNLRLGSTYETFHAFSSRIITNKSHQLSDSQ
jgi:hypothetical protein